MTKIILKKKRLHWWVISAGHVLEAKKFGISRRDLQTHNYLWEKPRLSFYDDNIVTNFQRSPCRLFS